MKNRIDQVKLIHIYIPSFPLPLYLNGWTLLPLHEANSAMKLPDLLFLSLFLKVFSPSIIFSISWNSWFPPIVLFHFPYISSSLKNIILFKIAPSHLLIPFWLLSCHSASFLIKGYWKKYAVTSPHPHFPTAFQPTMPLKHSGKHHHCPIFC